MEELNIDLEENTDGFGCRILFSYRRSYRKSISGRRI